MGRWEGQFRALEFTYRELEKVHRELRRQNSELTNNLVYLTGARRKISELQRIIEAHTCPVPDTHAVTCAMEHMTIEHIADVAALRRDATHLREQILRMQADVLRPPITEQQHLDAQQIQWLTDKNDELQDTIRRVLDVVRPETGPCNP